MLLLAALVAATAVLLAGCGGGDDESASGDPARLVPANTLFYGEAVVRPEGDQKEAIDQFLGALVDDDPGAQIRSSINESLPEGMTYEDDIEPWLGERVGVAVTGVAPEATEGDVTDGEDTDALVVVTTTDSEQALEKARELAEAEGSELTEGSYEDITFYRNDSGSTMGIVGDYLVLASTEQVFRQAVDTDGDEGSALSSSDAYTQELDNAQDDPFGLAYLNTGRFLDAVAQSGGLEEGGQRALESLGPEARQPVLATLDFASDQVTLEALTDAAQDGLGVFGIAVTVPELVAQLPGDAWGAIGVADVGTTLRKMTEQFAEIGGGTPEQIAQFVRSQTGIDLEADVFDQIGDVAVFLQGTGLADIGGALVLQVQDEARARELVQLGGELLAEELRSGGDDVTVRKTDEGFEVSSPQLPEQAVAAVRDGLAVLGYPRAVVESAFSPAQRLGDSPAYQTASEALGDGIEPSTLVSIPPILSLVQGLGGDLGDAQTRRALQALDVFALGTKVDGDQVTSRLVVKLKQ